jgi:hypothetical protein
MLAACAFSSYGDQEVMAQLSQLHTGAPEKPAIIFVHGLGGDVIDTWQHASAKATDFWPHWVGQDTDCDSWVLGYDAALSAWKEQAMPLPHQADQVADLLATEAKLKNKRLVWLVTAWAAW